MLVKTVPIKDDLRIEMHEIDISGKLMVVPVLQFGPEFYAKNDLFTQTKLSAEAYALGGAEFQKNPLSATMKSAVFLIDTSCMPLSKEFVTKWAQASDAKMFITQETLQQLFGKPVSLIMISQAIQNFKGTYQENKIEVKAETEQIWHVNSPEQGMELVRNILKLAHRL